MIGHRLRGLRRASETGRTECDTDVGWLAMYRAFAIRPRARRLALLARARAFAQALAHPLAQQAQASVGRERRVSDCRALCLAMPMPSKRWRSGRRRRRKSGSGSGCGRTKGRSSRMRFSLSMCSRAIAKKHCATKAPQARAALQLSTSPADRSRNGRFRNNVGDRCARPAIA